ncbi:hypothetical protein D3C80_1383480 [compost metagenome]
MRSVHVLLIATAHVKRQLNKSIHYLAGVGRVWRRAFIRLDAECHQHGGDKLLLRCYGAACAIQNVENVTRLRRVVTEHNADRFIFSVFGQEVTDQLNQPHCTEPFVDMRDIRDRHLRGRHLNFRQGVNQDRFTQTRIAWCQFCVLILP